MQKTLAVTIDYDSWPTTSPSFPSAFHRGDRECDFNIPALLLKLGHLTTPPRSAGASLSEYWAWVRYLCAISNEPDLRLVADFYELDPHQKTILSDDFGMGFPMYWLSQKLNLGPPSHGLYFFEHIAERLGVATDRPRKRGPRKSPDFVAMDASGKWHVIECKGTQSGIAYRNRQLGDAHNPTSGAVSQKRTITFPHSMAGQRLACGLSISFEDDDQPSNLRIIDPPDAEAFELDESHQPLATDAVWRSIAGRSLLLSGFRSSAASVVDPFGRLQESRLKRKLDREERQEALSQLASSARIELERREQFANVFPDEPGYFGRNSQIELPRSVEVGGKLIHRVSVRNGVHQDLLDDLSNNPVSNEVLGESDMKWHTLIDLTALQYEGLEASLKVGSLFRSEITLEQ